MNPKEKAANKEAFHKMSLSGKLDYIRTYYWGLILLTASVLVIAGTALYHHFTQKEQILYIALLNVVVGNDLEELLHKDYLLSQNMNPQRQEILFYQNMYIDDNPTEQNHELAYASNLKLLATISNKKLDLVLMNRNAYDIISGSDYLLDLNELSAQDEAMFHELEPLLTENTVIIEDNAIEYNLSEADTYQAVTKEVLNGIDISGISVITGAGFSDNVYMGGCISGGCCSGRRGPWPCLLSIPCRGARTRWCR